VDPSTLLFGHVGTWVYNIICCIGKSSIGGGGHLQETPINSP
jgi:hypothetical protein